jgi:hypothetical protein
MSVRDVAEVTAADDDIALLVMGFTGVPAMLEMQVPANRDPLAETRRRVRLWAAARACDDGRCPDALAAINEAFRDAMGPPNGAKLDAVVIRIVGDGDELLVTTDLRRGMLA